MTKNQRADFTGTDALGREVMTVRESGIPQAPPRPRDGILPGKHVDGGLVFGLFADVSFDPAEDVPALGRLHRTGLWESRCRHARHSNSSPKWSWRSTIDTSPLSNRSALQMAYVSALI